MPPLDKATPVNAVFIGVTKPLATAPEAVTSAMNPELPTTQSPPLPSLTPSANPPVTTPLTA